MAKFPENMHGAFPKPCPPDILVPLDIEAVKVVVGHVVSVSTLFEALNDGQLHAHGDVSGEY